MYRACTLAYTCKRCQLRQRHDIERRRKNSFFFRLSVRTLHSLSGQYPASAIRSWPRRGRPSRTQTSGLHLGGHRSNRVAGKRRERERKKERNHGTVGQFRKKVRKSSTLAETDVGHTGARRICSASVMSHCGPTAQPHTTRTHRARKKKEWSGPGQHSACRVGTRRHPVGKCGGASSPRCQPHGASTMPRTHFDTTQTKDRSRKRKINNETRGERKKRKKRRKRRRTGKKVTFSSS